MEWAHRIKAFRRQMGYKQTAAAEILGVSQATLSKWEAGLSQPTVAAQSKIYKAIGRDEDEVLIARQRFIVKNSSERAGLLEPDSYRVNAFSDASCKLFGVHPSNAEGFDMSDGLGDMQLTIGETLFRENVMRDKDVVRVSFPSYMFHQPIGQWIETSYHILPTHTASGVYSHMVATGKVLEKPPEDWTVQYHVHSVFGDETFKL